MNTAVNLSLVYTKHTKILLHRHNPIYRIAVRPCKRIKRTMRQRANGKSAFKIKCRYFVCMLTHDAS
jgi:hypothetical protein